MYYEPLEITRLNYIKTIWSITEQYDYSIDTEMLAINITNKYINYNKHAWYTEDLAFVTTIIAGKLTEDGCGLSDYKHVPNYNIRGNYLCHLEKKIILDIGCVYPNNYINHINYLLYKMNVNKKLGVDIIILLKYLVWCNINENFYTVLLAIQILRKFNKFIINNYMKYKKTYDILYNISDIYEIDLKTLINEYNKVKNIK